MMVLWSFFSRLIDLNEEPIFPPPFPLPISSWLFDLVPSQIIYSFHIANSSNHSYSNNVDDLCTTKREWTYTLFFFFFFHQNKLSFFLFSFSFSSSTFLFSYLSISTSSCLCPLILLLFRKDCLLQISHQQLRLLPAALSCMDVVVVEGGGVRISDFDENIANQSLDQVSGSSGSPQFLQREKRKE